MADIINCFISLLFCLFIFSGCLTPAKLDGWIGDNYSSAPPKTKSNDYFTRIHIGRQVRAVGRDIGRVAWKNAAQGDSADRACAAVAIPIRAGG